MSPIKPWKIFLTVLIISPLQAHHAMEFIELESYSTSPRGSFLFHLHHDYMVEDRDQPDLDHWELTPGFSYGITDRLMVDIHSHFAKFGKGHLITDPNSQFGELGPSPFMEALAFAIQYKITTGGPVDVGASLVYEEPFPRSIELIGGERGLEASLIINKPLAEHRNILLNLKIGTAGHQLSSGWGLGFRSPLTPDAHGIAAGLEIQGDYGGHYSLLPGVYFPLGMQDIIFKTGLEFVPGEGATRSNLTLMYRF